MKLFVRIPGTKDSEAIFSGVVESVRPSYIFKYLDNAGIFFMTVVDYPGYQFFDQTGRIITNQEAAKFLLEEYAKKLKQKIITSQEELAKPSPMFQTTCSHKWKKYVGFIEEYDYCEVCDEKRR